MKGTLGTSASGTFCTSDEVWHEMDRAGGETGDRFWRFPNFWEIYKKKVTGQISERIILLDLSKLFKKLKIRK